MPLQVYSTLSRKKEPFHRRPGEPVSMYVCGPTVYKPSHIGHMVGPVVFDTVKRYLTYLGYKVTWVVNITDVDDKLIARAGELGITVPALATKMTADYLDCLKALNVTGIDHLPKATEHVGGMLAMIGRLIDRGFAYPAGGDVYFDVSKDPDYGKLCNRDPEQLEAGSRVEVTDRKRNPGDFALWKGAKPGEPKEAVWESPWGPGRPGWHIECSVMATKLLGDTLDIHGGGLDLQFPHHENELAQSESATGKEFARVWMHNGLLKLKDKDGGDAKMAGSLGNVLNVADALKHVSGEVLRFYILQTHYRSPIDLGVWDWNNPATPIPAGLEAAKKSYDTFVRFAERVQRVTGTAFTDLVPLSIPASESRPTLSRDDANAFQKFRKYMDDDFNTGGAVGVLFELVTELNKLADEHKLEDPAAANPGAKSAFRESALLVKEFARILGLTFAPPEAKLGGDDQLTAGLMRLLIDLRNDLRTEAKAATKDNPLKAVLFGKTDLIRSRLAALGVTLEDRPGGTTWRVG
ncbi:MAG: cysteine--tRNA ligase [Gemmataceae bacterium]|nr:cysteine--tRNA ligase [Gemmataceae bacterium]